MIWNRWWQPIQAARYRDRSQHDHRGGGRSVRGDRQWRSHNNRDGSSAIFNYVRRPLRSAETEAIVTHITMALTGARILLIFLAPSGISPLARADVGPRIRLQDPPAPSESIFAVRYFCWRESDSRPGS